MRLRGHSGRPLCLLLRALARSERRLRLRLPERLLCRSAAHVELKAPRARPVAPAALDPWVKPLKQADLVGAVTVDGSRLEATLHIRPAPVREPHSYWADLLDVVATVDHAGRCRTWATFSLRAVDRQFLRARLPAGARLLSATVDGRVVVALRLDSGPRPTVLRPARRRRKTPVALDRHLAPVREKLARRHRLSCQTRATKTPS